MKCNQIGFFRPIMPRQLDHYFWTVFIVTIFGVANALTALLILVLLVRDTS